MQTQQPAVQKISIDGIRIMDGLVPDITSWFERMGKCTGLDQNSMLGLMHPEATLTVSVSVLRETLTRSRCVQHRSTPERSLWHI